MADVHLLWYTMDDAAVTAPRAEVRAWAQDLGLPMPPRIRRSSLGMFARACEAAKIQYTDGDGQQHLVTAREVTRTEEFSTYEVTRQDGKKMAQVKFFSARRTREGIVADTHVIKSIVSQRLAGADQVAARAWLLEAQNLFDQEEGFVSWSAIRRLVRSAVLLGAVPVRRRRTVFFCYRDSLGHAARTRLFIKRAAPHADFEILAIDDTSDFTMFAESADEFVSEQADRLGDAMRGWMAHPSGVYKRDVRVLLRDWTPRLQRLHIDRQNHERHLHLPLVRSATSLEATENLIANVRRLIPPTPSKRRAKGKPKNEEQP